MPRDSPRRREVCLSATELTNERKEGDKTAMSSASLCACWSTALLHRGSYASQSEYLCRTSESKRRMSSIDRWPDSVCGVPLSRCELTLQPDLPGRHASRAAICRCVVFGWRKYAYKYLTNLCTSTKRRSTVINAHWVAGWQQSARRLPLTCVCSRCTPG